MKKIGILTSGGDAPGMNTAIRAITRSALYNGLEVYGIYDGYLGLTEGKIKKFHTYSVANILNRGGTMLGSARLPEFKDYEVREKAVKQLEKFGIEALVIVGGDGSYRGAQKLTEMGINCIALPGTIDNDISSTDFTIGFFTALNTATESIDKLRDTSFSHRRCSIVEVMGRNCGDLAVFSGLAAGSEAIITSDTGFKKDELLNVLKKSHDSGKRHAIVVVTEHITDVYKLATDVQEHTGYETRATILGHVQRGGSPSSFDRVLASRMGVYAVELLMQGIGGKAVGLKGTELVNYDILKALDIKRDKHFDYYRIANAIK